MCVTMSSLYRDAKDGEIIGITIENKHINGLDSLRAAEDRGRWNGIVAASFAVPRRSSGLRD